MDLVERQGAIGGIQVRQVLAPKLGKTVVVFAQRADVALGEVWQGSGFTHDLLAASLCQTGTS